MKAENIKRDGNIVTFEVEEDYSELEIFITKKYRENVKKVKIPGFRQGKAPKNIFINYYGAERLAYEALMDLLNDKYPKIIGEHDIEVIDYPKDIKIITLEENQPIRVGIEVEVKPEVKVSKYKGIKLEKDSTKVEKSEVETEIDQFLNSLAKYEDDDISEIKNEDIVTLKISANHEGEEYEPLTKESQTMKIGGALINDEFDTELIGAKKGDKKTFEISFIEASKLDPESAGKTIKFEVSIVKVSSKKKPELTEELISKETESMTLSEYKKSVEEKLQANKSLAADEKLKNDVAAWISENVVGDIPEIMVTKEVDTMIKRTEMNLKQYRIDLPTYLRMMQKTEEDMRNEAKVDALRSVKLDLGIEYIGKAEGIEVTEAELEAEIDDAVKNEKDENRKEELRKQIKLYGDSFKQTLINRKVIDFILNSAKIKQKK